jgi:GT2 family glycosyltransferase
MTDTTPLISVCIANFNGMEVIDDCLRSVLTQKGQLSVEILIHDDASSDGSLAHIRDYSPHVKLLESQKNVGFCVANNRMAAVAKGKYLLLLNNDATLFPDALQTLLTEANRLDLPAILTLPQYDFDSGNLLDIGSLLDPFLNPVPNRNPCRGEVGMVMGACLWIPTSLWVELEGFPEWFGSIGEDLYLCSRARLAGYPVRALGSSGYKHRVGMSFGGGKAVNGRMVTTYRRRALSERNKSFVMVLTYPAPLLQLILPIHLVLLVMEGAALALIKWESRIFQNIYLACLISLWHKRRKLYSLRQRIQSNRQMSMRLYWSVFQLVPHKLRMLVRHWLPELR